MADLKYHRKSSVSPVTSFVEWVRLKNYQYEVSSSLYMLTPAEKLVFNSILFVLISLLVTAAYLYLPAHIFIIYNRVSYYIYGEHNYSGLRDTFAGARGALRATKELLVTQAANSLVSGQARSTAAVLREEL